MSNVLLYDPECIEVPYRVTNYLLSANTPDYDNDPNKVINPDVSLVSGIPFKYWKFDSGFIIEMSVEQKYKIDDLLRANKVRNKNYKISLYGQSFQLEKETWYEIDNGNEIYSGLAEETTYQYVNNNYLISKTVKTYRVNGTIKSTLIYDYYRNEKNELIEKLREE